MIVYKKKGDDMFVSEADLLVCPINCQANIRGGLVMGKGLAKAFAEQWPQLPMYLGRLAVKGRVRPGGGYTLAEYPNLVFVATKDKWAEPSKAEWICECLVGIRDLVFARAEATTVAVPALGCGEGGLSWIATRPLMETYLGAAAPHEPSAAHTFLIYPPRA